MKSFPAFFVFLLIKIIRGLKRRLVRHVEKSHVSLYNNISFVTQSDHQQLYFIQMASKTTACENEKEYAKHLPIYQFQDDFLINKGWYMITWSDDYPSYDSEPHLWFDMQHPKPELVERILVDWITMIKETNPKIGHILLVGDSTIGGCIGSFEGAIKRKELESRIYDRTSVRLYIFAVNGSAFTEYDNFVFQCDKAKRLLNGETYDAVLLVGGWNQPWYLTDTGKLLPKLEAFHTSALSVLSE